MREAFRPHESASIDEGLRVRLEGTIELLEDALPLLDSLRYLLARAESSKDDLATLQECVNQLPRIDEAIDKANRHEAAYALTQAVGDRKRAALIAANERLVTLGHEEAASLRAAVSSMLELVKRQGVAPQEGELRLMESPRLPWLLASFAGALVASVFFLLGHVMTGTLLGALTCILVLAARRSAAPWVLLPDRLYLPARWPRLSREIVPSTIQRSSIKGSEVTLSIGQESVQLRSHAPEELVSRLRLLGSKWLWGLRSPSTFVVVEAAEELSRNDGCALITKEGVLFVPKARRDLIVRALAGEKLPAELPLEEVLTMIGHLPEGRWEALAEHLERFETEWLPRASLKVDDNVVSVEDRRVSVRLRLSGHPRRIEAMALLKKV